MTCLPTTATASHASEDSDGAEDSDGSSSVTPDGAEDSCESPSAAPVDCAWKLPPALRPHVTHGRDHDSFALAVGAGR